MQCFIIRRNTHIKIHARNASNASVTTVNCLRALCDKPVCKKASNVRRNTGVSIYSVEGVKDYKYNLKYF